MKILMVLTSHDILGDTDLKTGFCLKSSQLLTLHIDRRRHQLAPGIFYADQGDSGSSWPVVS